MFDNDGTVWCEKPLQIPLDFTLRRLAEQAEHDPALRDHQPWKAAREQDHRWLSGAIVKHYRGDDSDLKLLMDGVERVIGSSLGRRQHEERLEQGVGRAVTQPQPDRVGMVWIEPGSFLMGSERHYPEEAPVRRVSVSGFWIDRHPVTNRQYAQFVAATGYRTVAERPLDPAEFPGAPPENLVPGSLVFTGTPGPVDLRHLSQWWAWMPGASWRRPGGPDSPPATERPDHPVVHVAHEDAAAYAAWAGGLLPTEAQWERAARGGIEQAVYTWGDDAEAAGQRLANYWHGEFPWRPAAGYGTTTPVGAFPANDFGLYDMAGNVWEWTADWWAERHPLPAGSPCCVPTDPRGPDVAGSFDPAQPQFRVPRKVIKGGSHLCADSYCLRYRPAARRPLMIDTGMSHTGFRCVRPG